MGLPRSETSPKSQLYDQTDKNRFTHMKEEAGQLDGGTDPIS